MYTDFFHLNEEPFQVTPNPKYLFLSNIHKEAVQRLADGIRRRKGFIEMVGAAGTGKTLLCKELVQMLSSEMDIAYLFYPVLNEQALYHAILKQWRAGISEEASVSLLLDKIYTILRGRFKKGRNALIIIDEAQNLSIPLLENLRLLSNLETESEKLLQILLTGQPDFHELLKGGKIPQLDQRIRVRVFLRPLDRETVPLYIYHRLNTAGAVGSLEFTNKAIDLIYRMSGGIPRMINTICERALEEAYRQKTYKIGPSIIQVAQEGLEGKVVSLKGKNEKLFPYFGVFYRLGLGILFLFFIGLAVWFAVNRAGKPLQNIRQSAAKLPSSPQKVMLTKGKIRPARFSGKLRVLPLNVMEHFLEGMLAVPDNHPLFWGELRLGQRDLAGLQTPVLLHIVSADETEGWVCARRFSKNGLQVWQRGEWKSLNLSVLDNWTGRCKVPYWIGRFPNGDRGLRLGSKGPSVSTLQRWLFRLGFLSRATGIFDSQTREAIRQFQIREGLSPDGIAGDKTLALLFQKAEIKMTGKPIKGGDKGHDK